MFRYALLSSAGLVIGISQLNDLVERDDYILLDDQSEVFAGDSYDAQIGEFYRPQPSDAVIQPVDFGWQITKAAFAERFTFDEQVDLEIKSATNPALRTLQKQLDRATYADLTLANYAEAMGMLVYTEVLSIARVEAIMTTPPVWQELPLHIQDRLVAQGYQREQEE